jgi:hypothetical protein
MSRLGRKRATNFWGHWESMQGRSRERPIAGYWESVPNHPYKDRQSKARPDFLDDQGTRDAEPIVGDAFLGAEAPIAR